MNLNMYMDAICGDKSYGDILKEYQDMIQSIFSRDSKDLADLVIVHSELKDKFKIDKKDTTVDTISICGKMPLRNIAYINIVQMATKSCYMRTEDFIDKYNIKDILRSKQQKLVDIPSRSFIETNYMEYVEYALYMVSKAHLYSIDKTGDIGEFVITHLKSIVNTILCEMKFLDSNQNISKQHIKEIILLMLARHTVYAFEILHKYLDKKYNMSITENKSVLKVIIYDDIFYYANISLVSTYTNKEIQNLLKDIYNVRHVRNFFKMEDIDKKLKYHNKHFNSKHSDFLIWKYIEEQMEYAIDGNSELGDILIQTRMLQLLYGKNIDIVDKLIKLDGLFTNIFNVLNTEYNVNCSIEMMKESANNMYDKCKSLYNI